MDCLAFESPVLGPMSTASVAASSPFMAPLDMDYLPSIELSEPSSPKLSHGTAMLAERAHETQLGTPTTAFGNGHVRLDVRAFARSFEPDLATFSTFAASPGSIPRPETVQRSGKHQRQHDDDVDSAQRRPAKRPRLMSLGSLAETDLLGVLTSEYDSLAASLNGSAAASHPILPTSTHIVARPRLDSIDSISSASGAMPATLPAGPPASLPATAASAASGAAASTSPSARPTSASSASSSTSSSSSSPATVSAAALARPLPPLLAASRLAAKKARAEARDGGGGGGADGAQRGGATASGSRSGRRGSRVADRRAMANAAADIASGVKMIGAYTVEERKARVQRFLKKRKERVWNHKVKYDCRKKLADNRPRYKGRFVRRADIPAFLAAQAKAKAAAEAAAAAAAAGSTSAAAPSGRASGRRRRSTFRPSSAPTSSASTSSTPAFSFTPGRGLVAAATS